MKRLVSILVLIFWFVAIGSAVFAEEPKGRVSPIPPAPLAATASPKPDPSGANSGVAADVIGASANKKSNRGR